MAVPGPVIILLYLYCTHYMYEISNAWRQRMNSAEWKQRNITLKMLVFCNGDGIAWCKICIGIQYTHTHERTHAHCTYSPLFNIESHSFIRWLACSVSVYLSFCTNTHEKCFQASPSHFDTCTHNFTSFSLFFFRSKTTTIDNNLHTHTHAFM